VKRGDAPRPQLLDDRSKVGRVFSRTRRHHLTDDTISKRLLATGQLLSLAGVAEFAASIEAQRATIASIAMEMGIKPAQRSQ